MLKTVLKKDCYAWHGCFPVNFEEIVQNNYVVEHDQATVSERFLCLLSIFKLNNFARHVLEKGYVKVSKNEPVHF